MLKKQFENVEFASGKALGRSEKGESRYGSANITGRMVMVMVMVMVICSALVRSQLIYLAVGSFGPVPSRVDRLHPLRPCLYM